VLSRFLGGDNALTLIISPVVVAALFQPRRGRLAARVDQRFYRGTYDTRKPLEAFAAVRREKVDLGPVAGPLVAIIEATLRPAPIAWWIRPAKERPRTTDLTDADR
jgi:hypothetical protein